MSKEASAYIFSFDSKSEVFTLTSSKDQLTIDSKHKKYQWLKGQEAGRVIKISATGRWNSSRDYDNLYQSIRPKKKGLKKSKTIKTNADKPGEYCFSFVEKEFVLTDQNGAEIKITSKHKKFEWLQSQDSGRVIKISEKGRWNSSKDYDGLYEKVKSSNKKPTKPCVSKPRTQKPKTDSSGEIKKLKSDLSELQKVNNKLSKELSALKIKNAFEPFQFIVEITSEMLPKKDYDYILIAFDDDETGKPLYSAEWHNPIINDESWKHSRHIILKKKPSRIVYWAHSKDRGWAERIEIIPETIGLDIDSLKSVRKYHNDRNQRTLNYQLSRVSEKEEEIKKLKNEIQLLKEKSQSVKPKATKKVEKIVVWKCWRIEFIATESYTYGGRKTKNECTIKLETEKLEEKPTQSYAKALLRQHIARKFRKYPIRYIGGLSDTYLVLARDYKLTNITILSIEES